MPENQDRVFDITGPGRSAPGPNARPMIVGHRPAVTDPMVRPIERTQPLAPNQPQPTDGLHLQPSTNLTPSSQTPTPTPALTGFSPLPPGLDNIVSSSQTPVQPQTPSDNLPPLPLSHEHGHHGGKSRSFMWLILLILTLLIGVYLAIDSGLIKTSINLPVHVFKQKNKADNKSSSSPTAFVPPTTTPKVSIPAGFTQYKDSSVPFVFDYPVIWGAASATTEQGFSKRGPNIKSDGVYAVTFNFATNKDVQLVATSGKYLPAARGAFYYDFGQWCIGTGDNKIYKNSVHFTTAAGIDTATTSACDQGPLTDATKLTTAIIVQQKTKDPTGKVLGDIYTANLDSPAYPVLRVKDAAMTNSVNIKTLLGTIH